MFNKVYSIDLSGIFKRFVGSRLTKDFEKKNSEYSTFCLSQGHICTKFDFLLKPSSGTMYLLDIFALQEILL